MLYFLQTHNIYDMFNQRENKLMKLSARDSYWTHENQLQKISNN